MFSISIEEQLISSTVTKYCSVILIVSYISQIKNAFKRMWFLMGWAPARDIIGDPNSLTAYSSKGYQKLFMKTLNNFFEVVLRIIYAQII